MWKCKKSATAEYKSLSIIFESPPARIKVSDVILNLTLELIKNFVIHKQMTKEKILIKICPK
jgi:hypothetical protein